MRHVDEFIDDPKSDRYAAEWFESYRRPVVEKIADPLTRKLFCTYKGKRWRVMGCSRIGDIWLNASTYKPDYGYAIRVDVDECSDWSER